MTEAATILTTTRTGSCACIAASFAADVSVCVDSVIDETCSTPRCLSARRRQMLRQYRTKLRTAYVAVFVVEILNMILFCISTIRDVNVWSLFPFHPSRLTKLRPVASNHVRVKIVRQPNYRCYSSPPRDNDLGLRDFPCPPLAPLAS